MPQIRPITDMRNTTEICHAKNEPVFITKNGYGDLVIMSMETYEALTSPAPLPPPPGNSEGLRFLTEKPPVWAGMLADVLEQHAIPYVKESTLGAGLAIKTGSMSERIRFYVPSAHFPAAKEIVEELFSENTPN